LRFDAVLASTLGSNVVKRISQGPSATALGYAIPRCGEQAHARQPLPIDGPRVAISLDCLRVLSGTAWLSVGRPRPLDAIVVKTEKRGISLVLVA